MELVGRVLLGVAGLVHLGGAVAVRMPHLFSSPRTTAGGAEPVGGVVFECEMGGTVVGRDGSACSVRPGCWRPPDGRQSLSPDPLDSAAKFGGTGGF